MSNRLRGPVLTLLLASVMACSSDSPPDPSLEWTSLHTSADWWMSVSAVSVDDRWIVGGTTDEGKIIHYDGSTMTLVDHGADVRLLNWVHAFESDELIVVGTGGAALRSDGTTWSLMDTPTDQDLWGVWGATPSDVWAVGGSAVEGEPTVLRDTGSGFEVVPIPSLERPGVRVFFKVWGSAADDVYIVGQNGAVLHWDGDSLDELQVGVGEDLIGIWGTGADRVVAVGGRRSGAAALWDGETWRTPDLAHLPGLNGVWLADDTVHVVGNEGSVGVIDFATGEATHSFIDTPVFLHSINGSPDGTLTAVGGDFSTGTEGPFRGEVVTRPVSSSE